MSVPDDYLQGEDIQRQVASELSAIVDRLDSILAAIQNYEDSGQMVATVTACLLGGEFALRLIAMTEEERQRILAVTMRFACAIVIAARKMGEEVSQEPAKDGSK